MGRQVVRRSSISEADFDAEVLQPSYSLANARVVQRGIFWGRVEARETKDDFWEIGDVIGVGSAWARVGE